jgi:LysR family transcriptional regulator (chromosome initiation inhibitor)
VAVNADSLATWAAPAIATFAAAHPVLMEVAVDDQDHTTSGYAAAQCWPP